MPWTVQVQVSLSALRQVPLEVRASIRYPEARQDSFSCRGRLGSAQACAVVALVSRPYKDEVRSPKAVCPTRRMTTPVGALAGSIPPNPLRDKCTIAAEEPAPLECLSADQLAPHRAPPTHRQSAGDGHLRRLRIGFPVDVPGPENEAHLDGHRVVRKGRGGIVMWAPLAGCTRFHTRHGSLAGRPCLGEKSIAPSSGATRGCSRADTITRADITTTSRDSRL